MKELRGTLPRPQSGITRRESLSRVISRGSTDTSTSQSGTAPSPLQQTVSKMERQLDFNLAAFMWSAEEDTKQLDTEIPRSSSFRWSSNRARGTLMGFASEDDISISSMQHELAMAEETFVGNVSMENSESSLGARGVDRSETDTSFADESEASDWDVQSLPDEHLLGHSYNVDVDDDHIPLIDRGLYRICSMPDVTGDNDTNAELTEDDIAKLQNELLVESSDDYSEKSNGDCDLSSSASCVPVWLAFARLEQCPSFDRSSAFAGDSNSHQQVSPLKREERRMLKSGSSPITQEESPKWQRLALLEPPAPLDRSWRSVPEGTPIWLAVAKFGQSPNFSTPSTQDEAVHSSESSFTPTSSQTKKYIHATKLTSSNWNQIATLEPSLHSNLIEGDGTKSVDQSRENIVCREAEQVGEKCDTKEKKGATYPSFVDFTAPRKATSQEDNPVCRTERIDKNDEVSEKKEMTYPSFVDFTAPRKTSSQDAHLILDESIIAKRKKKDKSLTRLLDCISFAFPKRTETRSLFRRSLRDADHSSPGLNALDRPGLHRVTESHDECDSITGSYSDQVDVSYTSRSDDEDDVDINDTVEEEVWYDVETSSEDRTQAVIFKARAMIDTLAKPSKKVFVKILTLVKRIVILVLLLSVSVGSLATYSLYQIKDLPEQDQIVWTKVRKTSRMLMGNRRGIRQAIATQEKIQRANKYKNFLKVFGLDERETVDYIFDSLEAPSEERNRRLLDFLDGQKGKLIKSLHFARAAAETLQQSAPLDDGLTGIDFDEAEDAVLLPS